MGRKVLFSFLGMTAYIPVRYALRDRSSATAEKFVQAALVELIDEPELVVRVGTTPEVLERAWPELKERLGERSRDVQSVPIAAAADEHALWAQFAQLGAVFEPDDTVYFDLTHGFRSLSAMALLSIAYFQRVRGFRVGGVFYGAFEALLNRPLEAAEGAVFKRPQDLGDWVNKTGGALTAPVFDLTAMFALPSWSEGFSTWQRTGQAGALVERTRPYLDALRRAARQDRPVALCDLPQKLQLASDAVTLVHHGRIGPMAAEVVALIKTAREQSLAHPSLAPLDAILAALAEDLGALTPPADDAELAALLHQVLIVRWLRAHNRFVEALTVARELVTSCAVSIGRAAGVTSVTFRERAVDDTHSGYRDQLDGWLMFLTGHQPEPRSPPADPGYERLRVWLASHPAVVALHREALRSVHDARNKSAHAFTGEHARDGVTPRTLDDRWRAVDVAAQRLSELVETLGGAEARSALGRCFVNLSNHPVETWSAAQREAAMALGFGEPTELPGGMPLVDPAADADAVQALANAVADRAVALDARGAFVATDLTLTVALVAALRHRGVRCFASTTARAVEESQGHDESIVRRSVFRFVRWREFL